MGSAKKKTLRKTKGTKTTERTNDGTALCHQTARIPFFSGVCVVLLLAVTSAKRGGTAHAQGGKRINPACVVSCCSNGTSSSSSSSSLSRLLLFFLDPLNFLIRRLPRRRGFPKTLGARRRPHVCFAFCALVVRQGPPRPHCWLVSGSLLDYKNAISPGTIRRPQKQATKNKKGPRNSPRPHARPPAARPTHAWASPVPSPQWSPIPLPRTPSPFLILMPARPPTP